jgi:hypothetical protein
LDFRDRVVPKAIIYIEDGDAAASYRLEIAVNYYVWV